MTIGAMIALFGRLNESGCVGAALNGAAGSVRLSRGEEFLPAIYRVCGGDLEDGEEFKQEPERRNGEWRCAPSPPLCLVALFPNFSTLTRERTSPDGYQMCVLATSRYSAGRFSDAHMQSPVV